MTASPTVTVLMSVYNGAPYLRASVDSILAQTWQDFEFVIVNDGSTDASGEVLAAYRDPRITVITQANQGLAAGLNRGLRQARGAYIARQDQDDVSLPGRLAAQLACLQARPRLGALGTSARLMDVSGALQGVAVRQVRHPVVLRWFLLFNNPLIHSSVMMRTEAARQAGGYTTDPARQPPEDYELWSRLALTLHWDLDNLPGAWVHNRVVPGSMTRNAARPFSHIAQAISLENLRRLDSSLSEERLRRLLAFATGAASAGGWQERCALIADFRYLERVGCDAWQLSAADRLRLRLHNRSRLLRRLMPARRHPASALAMAAAKGSSGP